MSLEQDLREWIYEEQHILLGIDPIYPPLYIQGAESSLGRLLFWLEGRGHES